MRFSAVTVTEIVSPRLWVGVRMRIRAQGRCENGVGSISNDSGGGQRTIPHWPSFILAHRGEGAGRGPVGVSGEDRQAGAPLPVPDPQRLVIRGAHDPGLGTKEQRGGEEGMS